MGGITQEWGYLVEVGGGERVSVSEVQGYLAERGTRVPSVEKLPDLELLR